MLVELRYLSDVHHSGDSIGDCRRFQLQARNCRLASRAARQADTDHRPLTTTLIIRPPLDTHCVVACYGLAASCHAHPVPPGSSVARLRLCSTSTPSPLSKLVLHRETRDLCTDAGLLKRQTAQASTGWLQNRRNSGMSKPSILSGAALCTLAP